SFSPSCGFVISVVERPRSSANSGIEAAVGIRKQRTPTKCCISSASGVANKRIITEKRVEAAGVAATLANGSRLRQKRKAHEGEWNEQQSERARRAVYRIFG